MTTQEYEAKIRCLEYENKLLERSRDDGWRLAGKLQAENECLRKEISNQNPKTEFAPKYYAQMSITKCV